MIAACSGDQLAVVGDAPRPRAAASGKSAGHRARFQHLANDVAAEDELTLFGSDLTGRLAIIARPTSASGTWLRRLEPILGSAHSSVDAGCQPGAREMVDAAYFPGFWLRQQRIGTRFA